MEKSCTLDIGGKKMIFSTGKIARLANSVLVKFGGNGVLITAVMNQNPSGNTDFFPLVVDVEERMYAAGKIPGGFFKREGRASDKAILNSRLTDRPLRPLFDKYIRNEVQLIGTVISFDQINPYDISVINGASIALYISDIPFEEPIGAVRIGKVGENWIINPDYSEIEESIIDIVVAGTEDAILMVEAGGKEVSEEITLEAIERAHTEIKKIVDFQKEFKKIAGKEKKQTINFELNKDVEKKVRELAERRIQEVLDDIVKYSGDDKNKALLDNTSRGYFQDKIMIIKEEIGRELDSEFPEDKERVYKFYLKNTKNINNWDLVDLSADKIVGKYLLEKNDISILRKLAKSKMLWERRIAILATFQFIKNGRYKECFEIVEMLLNDKEDLIHKATGWMLREVGKRVSEAKEEEFLLKHYKTMPRTMLRYAIERFSKKKRRKYLK